MNSDHASGVIPTVFPSTRATMVWGKKVCVSLPWYKNVSPITALCVAQILDSRRTSFQLGYGDAFIAHSRNKCAEEFLKSEAEWQLQIDDDVIFPTGNAAFFRQQTGWTDWINPFAEFNGLDRLMSSKKTIIGGLYFGRWNKGDGMFAEAKNEKLNELVRSGPRDEVRPTKWVATGFLLIHRSVYLDIEKRLPRLARGPDGTGGNWYSSGDASTLDYLERLQSELTDGPLDGKKAYRALEVVTAILADARGNSPLGQGEDVCLCTRAATAGHQPFVDLGVVCGHLGMTVYGPKNTGMK